MGSSTDFIKCKSCKNVYYDEDYDYDFFYDNELDIGDLKDGQSLESEDMCKKCKYKKWKEFAKSKEVYDIDIVLKKLTELNFIN